MVDWVPEPGYWERLLSTDMAEVPFKYIAK